jgi:hypothetical protein
MPYLRSEIFVWGRESHILRAVDIFLKNLNKKQTIFQKNKITKVNLILQSEYL